MPTQSFLKDITKMSLTPALITGKRFDKIILNILVQSDTLQSLFLLTELIIQWSCKPEYIINKFSRTFS